MTHEGDVHGLIELVAAIVLIGGGSLAIAALWWRAARTTNRAATTDAADPHPLRSIIASASIGAGVIHLALWPSHVDELGDLGSGFLIAGVVQVVWGVLAIRGVSARRWRFALWFNGAVLGAWTLSCTVGLPAGAHPWSPDPIGRPDLVAALLEGFLIVAAVAVLRSGQRWHPSRSVANAAMVAMVPSVGVIAVATIVALSGPAGH